MEPMSQNSRPPKGASDLRSKGGAYSALGVSDGNILKIIREGGPIIFPMIYRKVYSGVPNDMLYGLKGRIERALESLIQKKEIIEREVDGTAVYETLATRKCESCDGKGWTANSSTEMDGPNESQDS